MKRWSLFCVLLLAGALLASAEVSLTAGTSGEASLADLPAAGIEPFLAGSASLTQALSDSASGLADAAFRLGYGWPGQGLTWFAFGSAGLSWRGGPFFVMAGGSATGEGDATGSVPLVEGAAELELTLDMSAFTVSLAPTFRARWGEESSAGVDGEMSSIVSAGDAAVLRAKLRGGVQWPQALLAEWWVGAGLGASWYPAPPLVVSVDAGLTRRFSDNAAEVVIDGTDVTIPNAASYLEVSILPELSVSLGRGLRLGLSVPAAFRAMDHGSIVGTAVTAEPEWVLSAAPVASLRIEASRTLAVKAALGFDLVVSNSSYLEKRVAHLTLDATISLD